MTDQPTTRSPLDAMMANMIEEMAKPTVAPSCYASTSCV